MPIDDVIVNGLETANKDEIEYNEQVLQAEWLN